MGEQRAADRRGVNGSRASPISLHAMGEMHAGEMLAPMRGEEADEAQLT